MDVDIFFPVFNYFQKLRCYQKILILRQLFPYRFQVVLKMETPGSISSSNCFKSRHLSCPVTCLKLDSSKRYLFVCQGPQVTILASHGGNQSWCEPCLTLDGVLPAGRIHGVELLGEESDRVFFFGQKQLRLARFYRSRTPPKLEVKKKDDDIALVLEDHIIGPDWLWEVKFLASSSELAWLTAHNQLRRYDLVAKKTLCVAEAPESHILYSASIIGDEWKSIVVAAGTVFNRVILWSPFSEDVVTLIG